MREKTRNKLQSYRDGEPQRGGDGEMHVVDKVTRIPWEQSESLAALHAEIRPDLSLETGLAYGFSTLPILDAMAQHGYGHHLAIDPIQMGEVWHGIAHTAIHELGFASRFTLVEQRSDQAVIAMIQAGRRVQFAFLDGEHSFDGLVTDFFLIDQIMDEGGVMIVNDMWLPAARSVRAFLRGNMEHYREVPTVHENVFVMRKSGRDARAWNHFTPFDASGRTKPPGLFRRLFGAR